MTTTNTSTNNNQYHLKYKNFNDKTIQAVKKAILGDEIFRVSPTERLIILNELNDKLCEIYHILRNPRIEITDLNSGYYDVLHNTIFLSDKLSLITFLHEFKHFLQITKQKPNNEDIARGWSLSLFYLSSPRHFNRALRKGLIFHEK